MKKLSILFSIVLVMAMSSMTYAATWIAICNDGKNLQYNQTRNGSGFLYMKVKDSRGGYHTYQMAKLKQTFYNGIAICGTVLKNGTGNSVTGGNPITQLCANKSRKTIYVKYKHPYQNRPFESGVFCRAKVIVR